MDLGINRKAAVITGASRGIGLAIARRLAHEGARLTLIARNAAALSEAALSLDGPFASETLTIACDVTDPDQVKAAAAQAISRFGGIDILVNNAGGLSTGGLDPFDTLTDENFLDTFALNVLSAVRFTRAALPGMCERGWGRIISISSESGVQPDPVGADYNAAKAALNTFSKTLSKAYGEKGVRANVVSPAFTLTDGVNAMIAQYAEQSGTTLAEAGEAMRRTFRPNITVGRGGNPDDIAEAVAFLASESAAFINGTILRVDGGSVASVGS